MPAARVRELLRPGVRAPRKSASERWRASASGGWRESASDDRSGVSRILQ